MEDVFCWPPCARLNKHSIPSSRSSLTNCSCGTPHPPRSAQAEEEARLAAEAAAKLALRDPEVAAIVKLLEAGKGPKDVSRGPTASRALSFSPVWSLNCTC